MAKATFKDIVLAESNKVKKLEGNIYFPPESVNQEFLEESNTHTTCPWKGKASYYNVLVNGENNDDAAWFYPNPNPAAQEIKNYIAFWKGVKVED